MNMGRDALLAYELAMQVTSHNIANAMTRVIRARTSNWRLGLPCPWEAATGNGVMAHSVSQAFDQYTSRSIQQNASPWPKTMPRPLPSPIWKTFSMKPRAGIESSHGGFLNAWQDLASNPGGVAERTALLDRAAALTTQFRSMSADLNQVKQSMNANLRLPSRN